jgi:hypothetical protein
VGKNSPKIKTQPDTRKTPRKAGFDENPMRLRPAWRIGQMEFCDPFGWHTVDANRLLRIHERLRSFETMSLGDIIGRHNHLIPINRLSKVAQDRLHEINLDDIEMLISLRFTGAERVWGILEHNVVILLWWDPNHAVCPMNIADN